MYTTLFLDIGGLLLTNGWDHALRERAARQFELDFLEMNKRHALIFDTYEIGKVTLDDYLDQVVFFKPRRFSREDFKEFMFSQAKSYPEVIDFFKQIKSQFSLKVVAVSNEGRELMNHRTKKFQLKELFDFFVCSGFVGVRKPDIDLYRMALEMSQANRSEVIYIDDRSLLVEIGKKFGLQSINHVNLEETKKQVIELLQQREIHAKKT